MNMLSDNIYTRTLAEKVLQTSRTFPAVLITGPRQVGKTTVFLQCMQKEPDTSRTYISLDDVKARQLAVTDPELFLDTYRYPVLIDEVQYAPELFPYIKIICDREQKPGLFWLTGSQQFSLMQHVSESLAGRVGILKLQGLSWKELNRKPDGPPFSVPETVPPDAGENLDTAVGITELYEHILRGSYPALYARPDTDIRIFYSSYVQTYLERDVQSVLKVTDQHVFLECMRVLAARTGQLLNYTDVAKDIGTSVNTVKNWISVLEASGIIYLLQPWSSNLTKRAVKTPKLYFMDTGLCCYLTGWKTADALMDGIMNGSILETYVISEILKSWIHNGEDAPAYFYRDKERHEIDLILYCDGKLHPVEIKRSANPDLSMTSGFRELQKADIASGRGAVICLYHTLLPLSRSVISIPVWSIY